MTVVRMFGGVDVDLLNPDLGKVSIGSIFRTLSMLNRYNGQTCRPYTVLEHSIRGAETFAELGEIRQAKAFLMHDAHEAFIGDITTPVARAAEIQDQLFVLKTRLDETIEERYNVSLFLYSREIAAMDHAMFRREWHDLMEWDDRSLPDAADLEYLPLPLSRNAGPHRDRLLSYAVELWERWSK
jgi:hypothetical protein